MITLDNYEGWLMSYADGELDAEGRKAVEAFLAEHPALREELEAVSAVKVTPPVAVLPHKEHLLRKTTVLWPRAVAATVALLLVVSVTLTLLPVAEQPATVSALVPATEVPSEVTETLPITIETAPKVMKVKCVPSAKSLIDIAETSPDEEPSVTVAEMVPEEEAPAEETSRQEVIIPVIIETDKLAVVVPSTTITEGYVIDVQLTTTPMQTLVRNLLALKEE